LYPLQLLIVSTVENVIPTTSSF